MAKDKLATTVDFQAQRDSFLSSIMTKVNNVLTLEIKTIVCELDISVNSNDNTVKVQPKPGNEAEGIVTRIKLMEGDIDSVMTKEFAGGQYKSLREFHQLKETQAQEIVRKNFELVQSIVTTISQGFENEQKGR